MNRIPEALANALAHATSAGLPAEALVCDGLGLIKMLQSSLFEMHEQRRQFAGTSQEPRIAQEIKYWQEVLGWIQSRGASQLVLMHRNLTP